MALLFAALLASFASVFFWVGAQAVATQRQELEWREGGGLILGPIGFAGQRRQGVEVYRGADAIRMGVGYIASATMFGVWFAMIISGGVLGWRPAGELRVVGQVGAVSSLLSLLLCSACFFPPWQIWAAWFWAEIVIWAVFFGVASRTPRIREYGSWVGTGIILTSIVLGSLAIPGAFVGLALGLFASIIGLAHVIYLSPGPFAYLDDAAHEGGTESR